MKHNLRENIEHETSQDNQINIQRTHQKAGRSYIFSSLDPRMLQKLFCKLIWSLFEALLPKTTIFVNTTFFKSLNSNIFQTITEIFPSLLNTVI